MRRILFCALLTILTSTPLLNAQDPDSAIASLRDLSHRGQIAQVIQAANTLLATGLLTPSDQAMALIYLGYAYQQRKEFTQAISSYEKALTVLDRDGQHPSQYAGTLATLATVYAQTGQVDTAKHALLRSVHMFEKQSDHAGAAMIWSDLATIATDQHACSDAHKYMARVVAEQQLAGNIAPSELATSLQPREESPSSIRIPAPQFRTISTRSISGNKLTRINSREPHGSTCF